MKNILLVDDDTVCNFISSKLLKALGFAKDIRIAANGDEALKIFEEYYNESHSIPDVIFLDLNMPVMDGFDFLMHFATYDIPSKELIKIVILTSSQNPDDIQKAKKLGVTRFLTKPLLEEDLRKLLT